MKNLLQVSEYKNFHFEIKKKVRLAQVNATVHVIQELLMFYWDLGAAIVEKQRNTAWGDGFLRQLSSELMGEFPNMKGFSKRNLELIRQWHLFWSGTTEVCPEAQFAKQAVSQITRIPWGHNLAIIAKCKQQDEALFYVHATLTHGWSRSVLTHQIESGLWEREGKALSNFQTTLPSPQSDLARQTLKDP